MNAVGERTDELRILVRAPTGRDGALGVRALREAGLHAALCNGPGELAGALRAGAGALLVAEEALEPPALGELAQLVAGQPAWSDLPVLLLARQGADSPELASIVSSLGNVTLLERPTRIAALVSAARTALRARARQYEIRSFLEERERTERALREADRRKDEFLAVLAHELRNPLAPLRNALHLFGLFQSDDRAREMHEMREMMERQVDHMVRLVDDLLEVSRITRGKIELRRELVELGQIVRSAVETSRPIIENGGQRLTVSLPEETLTLFADPVRLTQVLSNLLNNASRYSDPDTRIALEARRVGGELSLRVRDEGIGIAPELLPRVFEMFAQGDARGGRRTGGLGIGLTLAHSLVQMHGGTVSARSEGPGRGSEFEVRLPLATRVAEESPEVRVAPPSEVPPLDVLVVDDNRDAADSLALVLGIFGATARVAYEGASAMQLIEERRPELVLLDIGMPGMDGFEVARAVRRRPEGRGIVLVALTGWGQDEDRRRSRLAGFDHHLVKPVDLDALRGLMRALDEAPGAPSATE